ncbi:MAG: dolichol-phosphate mannosyltransferase, partial [Phenylobacterium sp.]|nr:dolichol-phosphate mannosyltransferase [Phenylobacterium sp.]
LKAFRRHAFLELPFFDHIHRYLPALMLREGYQVAFPPVGHRHRQTGASKYTNLGRLWASASDLLGVMWLQTRSRRPDGVDEV